VILRDAAHMVPNIEKRKDGRSYRLVVAISCLDLLSKIFNDKLINPCNPFMPAEDDVRLYGTYEATKRARADSLFTAVQAIRVGREYGSAEYNRDITMEAGLGTALERAILNWDIQVSLPYLFLLAYLLISPSILALRSAGGSPETSFAFSFS